MSHLKSWAAILGGDVSGLGVICPGPGHSRRDRSLSVTPSVASPGFITHSFAGDDWRTCHEYVGAKLGIEPSTPRRARTRLNAGALAEIKTPEPVAAPNHNMNRAGTIWRESAEVKGTLAESYLASRGLPLDDGEDWHCVLRFHPACPFGAERAAAMITLMRDILTDAPRCIQRTRLTPDGRKADRQMLGPAKGAAIKVDPDADVTQGLCIGEGLETPVSGRLMGFRPAWALGSAGAIASFPVRPRIDGLHIFGERDATGANERAVDDCGRRWIAAGRTVITLWPEAGSDLNDEWRCIDG